jgi:glycosyltransferase involved in cell wall biosynthesis
MRIYFIGQKGIPTLAGGIEKHVESLAVEMARQGHEVFVYTRPYYTDSQMTEYEGVHLISLPTIQKKNADAIFHTFLATMHVLFQKADIIHYQGIGPSLLLWIPKLLKRKAKIVSTVHSDDRQHAKWSPFAKYMLGLGAKIAVRVPDASIAIARYQKDDFEKEFGGSMAYIPNGVTLRKKYEPNFITKKFGLQGDDYVFFISRFVKHKGLHYLIEAYKQISNPGKKLVITGDSAHTDEYSREIRALAQGNPNIIFTGVQSGQTLFELYSNAYLYVIPSEYEGLSIALLEVMSYGTPVLASDITPNLEALAGEGVTFENKNVADLKEKLQYLLDNPEVTKASGAKLQKRVQEEYDWKRITKETLDLYSQIT